MSAPRGDAELRLFCYHHGAGNAAEFMPWASALGPRIDVRAAQLPGRLNRFREAPMTRLGPIVDALLEATRPELDKPFAFFGHSLGARIGFELVRALERAGGPLPVALFVSATSAPHIAPESRGIEGFNTAQMVDLLRWYGGMPEEALADPEMRELVIPTAQADFVVFETAPVTPPAPLPVPLIALYGKDDSSTPIDRVRAWKEHAGPEYEEHGFAGGHFFIRDRRQELLELIRARLLPSA